MKVSTFLSELWLPQPVADIFPFFADARNLQAITPGWLNFQFVTPLPIEMRVGAFIDYRLRLRGIPLCWQTEITAWEPPHRFVDEQRRGPYRLWAHEHRFEERDGGTLMTDEVRYSVIGGVFIERLFVRRDIRRIFDYRSQKLRELFGARRVDIAVNSRSK